MSKRTAFALAALVVAAAGLAILGIYGMHQRNARLPLLEQAKMLRVAGQQLTVDDLNKCVRTNYIKESDPEKDKSKPLPAAPRYTNARDMAIGEQGWVTMLYAHEHKLFMSLNTDVAPKRTNETRDVYSTSTYNYHVHVMRVATGFEVDCDQPSPEVYEPNSLFWVSYHQDTDSMLPITGMFHGKKK